MADSAKVIPLSTDWPGRPLPVSPGDFSRYLPHGMGLAAPTIVRPWDDPLQAMSRRNYYGFEALEADPVRGAPTQYAEGGVIYFDADADLADINTAMMLMGVRQRETDYVVIARAAADPRQERYLDQVRIMRRSALATLFGCGAELAAVPKPPVSVEGYVAQFIAEQREKWDAWKLAGTAGGDGDFAKERLSFGFMVENGYWSAYRMWSRPWLITK